ncbi:putative mitochondrial-processing peptidase subunit beta isoform B [Chlorella sorokiniana]|uniref:Mitochondrial-processing peptidase subunit beta isoform B n=1 Tax=Chlorella sorokiniana TaxID=3076 RepID=A0A2P6TBE3_CHLSO|nr:putative mitochondrial-processing peptidase subunit beta isoform B [Chlorella sorokiniana]|eukprot:PRW05874.1 putative mitochondrial-processing peptidase subunit beta isoform B [Chlorella sorokiniana]
MAAAEGDDARVLQALFESYAAACRTGAEAIGEADADAAFEEGVERVKEHLLSAAGEAACCMICLEGIRPADPVWSCQAGCYAVMHLPCIQSWARRTLTTAAEKAGQAQPLFPGAPQPKHSACWACPKCRAEYEAVPSGYFCWCGKEEAPPFNPWNAAHSCGERCERRAQGCGHPCVLLCHPVCHDGDCPPCPLVSDVACRCGAEAARLPCSQKGVFQCKRVCGKLLACGRHRCEEVCHAGKCGACKLAGPKACPCGKTQPPEAACDVVVPPCGETCGKLLSCGVHVCHERCHTGPCPQTCRETVVRSCECGKTQRTMQCQEGAFRCERRCTSMRACGRHPCRRRCCDGVSCPPCDEVCNKWLKCRNHRCPAPCHSGECAPCPLSARISCACGKTSYSQACPPCEEPITRPCHCGKTTLSFVCQEVTAEALPAARLCCGKTCHRQLPGCPHTCMRECHEGPCSSDGCSQEVTVRCSCKRRKEKLSCAEVQRLLQAATGSAAYDAGTSLRLLPCDAACAKAAAAGAAAEPAAKGADSSSKAAANAAKAGRAAGPQPGQAAQQQQQQEQQEQQPRRKLSKEEKQRLAEEKQRAKEAAARRQQLLQGLVLAAVLLVAVVLALGVRHLLQLADQTAQAKWGNLQQEL